MSTILCYGDSNTHGTMPLRQVGVSERLPKGQRWPDVMAATLGSAHEVISEGLPGRTTVHDDPVEGFQRNGLTVLPAILHSHKPIDLTVLMLGTNDLKNRFSVTAYEIARSLERLIMTIQSEQVCRDILLVCPASVRETGTMTVVYEGAEKRQTGLGAFCADVAQRLGCGLVLADDHVTVSDIDGVHWTADAHKTFGIAMAQAVQMRLDKLQ